MKEKSVDEMANDTKLVEQTRAKIKAKNLERIALKKRMFRNIFLFVLVMGITSAGFGLMFFCLNKDLNEKIALQIRDQELKELSLIDNLREVKMKKIAREAKRTKEQAEKDDFFKHWPNVMIIFANDSYDHGTEFIKKSDKPYVNLDVGRGKTSGYMVTGELAALIAESGLRFQRHSVAFGAGFTKEDIQITVFEKFINW